MPTEIRRKTPEELLRDCQAEERAASRGKLKIFLGYASGVGKSYRMLDEARRRRQRGEDVVVGGVQPEVPPEVATLLRKLEVIPLRTVDGRSVIDMPALLRRHPAVCVIDGLAYDNPPGSPNPTRWEDVQVLLNAGIAVIASINIQYVGELREQVQAITEKSVAQTVPVAFLREADEIEIVDAPPAEPLERTPDQQTDAERRQQQLSRLRELALVLAADVVDRQLTGYLERNGITEQYGTHERILVCITPRGNVREMVDMAHTIAQRFHAELIAAYVHQPHLSAEDQAALDEKLAIARAAGARIEILHGEDFVQAILDFVQAQRVTQVFMGHSQRTGLRWRIWGSPVDKIIRQARGVDVRVFPQ
jgi:two-component system sensor histidine kinase KdpD